MFLKNLFFLLPTLTSFSNIQPNEINTSSATQFSVNGDELVNQGWGSEVIGSLIFNITDELYHYCEICGSIGVKDATTPIDFKISNMNIKNEITDPTTNISYEVTSIDDRVFSKDNDCLIENSLTISDSVSYIGEKSFLNQDITSLNIIDCGQDLTIGNKCFYGCCMLNGELKLPNELKSIGDRAFANSILSKVYFPNDSYDLISSSGSYIFSFDNGQIILNNELNIVFPELMDKKTYEQWIECENGAQSKAQVYFGIASNLQFSKLESTSNGEEVNNVKNNNTTHFSPLIWIFASVILFENIAIFSWFLWKIIKTKKVKINVSSKNIDKN